MPRITVEMLEGRTLDQKRALTKAISTVAAECFNIPMEYVLIRFVEVRFEDFASDNELRCDSTLKEGKPVYGKRLEPRVTIQLLEGRTLDQKRALVKHTAEKIAEILAVPLKDVLIYVLEMKKDELAFGGVFPIDGTVDRAPNYQK